MTEKKTIIIPASTWAVWLKAAKLIVSTDRARPLLCGVHLQMSDNGELSWTASDSYRIVQAYTGKGEGWTSLGVVSWKDISPTGWTFGDVVLSVDEEHFSVTHIDRGYIVPLTPGEYPNVDKVFDNMPDFDKEPAYTPTWLDAELLGKCLQAAHLLSVRDKADHPLIRLYPTAGKDGLLKPVWIRSHRPRHLFDMAIMPVRV